MPTKFYKDIQIPYDVIIYSKDSYHRSAKSIKTFGSAIISNAIASKF